MNKKFSASERMNLLLIVSLILAVAIILFGGLKEKETTNIIDLVVTLSVTMAGFGLVAFQVGHSTDELKKDFIESSIIMILSTISGFFFLVYPDKSLFNINFGEISIFMFFWAFILFLIILIDRRFDILK